MSIPIQSRTQIERRLLEEIVLTQPTSASFEKGSAAYDIFIRPLSGQITDFTIVADYISRQRSLAELEKVIKDANYQQRLREALNYTVADLQAQIKRDLDNLVSNWNITRIPAQKARGYLRLYATSDVVLTFAAGQQVGTIDDVATFNTLNGFSFFTPTYSSEAGLYYVDCSIECTLPGAFGNQIAGRIRRLKSSPNGIISCNNLTSTLFGADEESDIALINRARTSWRSRNNSVLGGLIDTVQTYPGVIDTSVVLFGDALMERDARGAVDIYLIAESKVQTAQVVIDTTGARYVYDVLDDETTFDVYPPPFVASDSVLFKLPSQPVLSIANVNYKTTPNGAYTSINPSNYSLIKDTTGVNSNSIKGNDVLQISGNILPDGSFVKVVYSYNRICRDLQALFDITTSQIPGADILFKLGTEKAVVVEATPIVFASYVPSEVYAVIQSDLSIFFTGGVDSNDIERPGFKLGEVLDKSDLLNVILDVEGVDRVPLETFSIKINNTEIVDQYSPLKSEYLRLGSASFATPPPRIIDPITSD